MNEGPIKYTKIEGTNSWKMERNPNYDNLSEKELRMAMGAITIKVKKNHSDHSFEITEGQKETRRGTLTPGQRPTNMRFLDDDPGLFD